MHNMNSGYDGYSMSKRAVEAYGNGEKPYSKWKKSDILERLKEYDTSVEYDFLKKLPLTILKEMYIKYSSYHHTGKFCNSTNFYDFEFQDYSKDEILEMLEFYKKSKEKEENKKTEYYYAYMKFYVWTRNKYGGKSVDTDYEIGIVVGKWLYYNGGKNKLNINANKVIDYKFYSTYKEFVKEHKDFVGSSKLFNKILKNLKLK